MVSQLSMTTEGQKAFKKLQDCLEGIKDNRWEWFRDRQFYLNSVLNAFNARYCNFYTPRLPATQTFDPIFLKIGKLEKRVAAVNMIVDAGKKTVSFELTLFGSFTTKDLLSSVEYVNMFDKSVYLKNGLVKDLFSPKSTTFESNALKITKNKPMHWRVDINRQPYLTIVNNHRKFGDGDLTVATDASGLMSELGYLLFVRDNMVPYSLTTQSTKLMEIRKDYYQSNLTDRQKELVLIFLFGPEDGEYFESNIEENKGTKKWSFTEEPTILPWDSAIIGNLKLSPDAKNIDKLQEAKLIAYLKDRSDTERGFDAYEVELDADKADDVIPSNTPKKQANSSDSDEESVDSNEDSSESEEDDSEKSEEDKKEPLQPEPKNTVPIVQPKTIPVVQPKPAVIPQPIINNQPAVQNNTNNQNAKSTNEHILALQNLIRILETITPQQIDEHYWTISNFLNTFNFFYCNTVFPIAERTRVKPIFVTIKQGNKDEVFRLSGVHIYNNNQFTFAFHDATGKPLNVFHSAKGPLKDVILSPSQANTKPFMGIVVRQEDSFVVKFKSPVSLFGTIERKYDPGMFENPLTTDDICLDSLGLANLIQTTRWYVQTEYVPKSELSVLPKDQVKKLSLGKTRLNQNQQDMLRSFLFSVSPDDDFQNLDSALRKRDEWLRVFDFSSQEKEWLILLDVIKTENPEIYNRLAKPGGDFPDLPVPQDLMDIPELIEKAPRAKLLYTEIMNLEGRIQKLADDLGAANRLLAERKENNVDAETQAKLEKAEKLSEINDNYYLAVFSIVMPMLGKASFKKNPLIITKELVASTNADIQQLQADAEVERAKLEKVAEPNAADLVVQSNISAGVDVVASKKIFSEMIRKNIYKGKYNVEVMMTNGASAKPDLSMQFKNINTYTDENHKLVYGALCSKNTQQVFNTVGNNTFSSSKGNMMLRIKDEQNRVIKEKNIFLENMPNDGHTFMAKGEGVRLYLTRADDSSPLGVKMVIIDV